MGCAQGSGRASGTAISNNAEGNQPTTDNAWRASATQLMSVSQRCPKHRAVLQFADDAIEAFVALQRDVLRILIADGAELASQLAFRNARSTKTTVGISVRSHV
jgi:hypothetical protein